MEWYYAEGKEQKGPVSEEQFAELVRSGAVQASTLVWHAGMPAWKPYGEVYQSQPPATPPPPLSTPGPAPTAGPLPFANLSFTNNEVLRDQALAHVRGPAICLMIYGGLMGLLGILSLIGVATGKMTGTADFSGVDPQMAEMMKKLQGPSQMVGVFLNFIVAVVVFFGGLRMLSLKSYGLAIAAAVCACLPCGCPCCFLGIGVGVWSLVILNKPEVKDQFD